MATVSKWTPFGVALDITATAGTVTRTSATQFKVVINASWETYYSGAQTNYGMTAASGGVTHTISAFNGTKRSNGSGSFTGTYSISGNGAATKTITVTFRNFNTDNGDSATKNVSFSVNVPAWTSYVIKYNANGGSGAPGNQTKWKDQALTLSTTKPTRTGYSFLGWSTSSSATSATYSAGGSYTANSAATLYAVWKANTYTVQYNANGGSGAPGNQTKTYGVALTLSSTKPTRTNYNFKGWGTSASATTVAYASGASYTNNAAITLYAVWELAYIKPRISNLSVVRSDSEGVANDEGTNALISFDWECDQEPTSINIKWKVPSSSVWTSVSCDVRKDFNIVMESGAIHYQTGLDISGSHIRSGGYLNMGNLDGSLTLTPLDANYRVWIYRYDSNKTYVLRYNPSNGVGTEIKLRDDQQYIRIAVEPINGAVAPDTSSGYSKYFTASYKLLPTPKSGVLTHVVGSDSLSVESSYDIHITVADGGGSSYVTGILTSMKFAIDALAGGKGVAFGKTAELEDTAEFEFEAKFNSPVYGKALGMDRLPAIPSNSDLNNYLEPGCYAIHSNAVAATCANIPADRAGRLEVWSATGEGVRAEQWSYLRQRYIPYNSSNAIWERELTRGEDNVWTYYSWWRSSLTPSASEKVYSKAAMSIGLSANTVLGAVNTYTKIPFDKTVLSTNSRLTLSSNAIRVGSNIQYVKVSGQVLVSPGATNGLRHVRIQKVSGSTTSSVAWNTLYVTASQHKLQTLTPLIVSVKEGDLLQVVFYTGNENDSISSGSAANGWQTYLTVEEL